LCVGDDPCEIVEECEDEIDEDELEEVEDMLYTVVAKGFDPKHLLNFGL
jgi:hypothetical protein